MRPLDPQSIFSSSSVFNLKQARSVGLVRAWRPSFTFHVVPSLSRTILLRLPPSAARFAGAFSPGSFQNRVGESWPQRSFAAWSQSVSRQPARRVRRIE